MSKKREFNHLTQQQQQKEESIHILTVLCHLRRHGLPPLYLFLYTTQAQVFSHESSLVFKALNPIPGRVSLNFNPSIHGHGPKRIKSNIIAENKKKMINCGDYLDFDQFCIPMTLIRKQLVSGPRILVTENFSSPPQLMLINTCPQSP